MATRDQIEEHLRTLAGSFNRNVGDKGLASMMRGWAPVLEPLPDEAIAWAVERWCRRETQMPVAAQIATLARQSPHVPRARVDAEDNPLHRCETCGERRGFHKVIRNRRYEKQVKGERVLTGPPIAVVIIDEIRHTAECPAQHFERRWLRLYGYEWAYSMPHRGVLPFMGQSWDKAHGALPILDVLPEEANVIRAREEEAAREARRRVVNTQAARVDQREARP